MRAVVVLFAVGLVTLARAETVVVADRGQVDLAPFSCQDVTRSRFIRRVCFDAADAYLLVSLDGVYSQYCGVTPDMADAFVGARSVDRFYERNLAARRRRPSRFACQAGHAPSLQASASPKSAVVAPTTPVKVWGYGTETCDIWNKDHQSQDRDQVTAEDSWLSGFITAFEMFGHAADSTQKLEAMPDWIDSHCRSNPSDTLSNAAQTFTGELTQ